MRSLETTVEIAIGQRTFGNNKPHSHSSTFVDINDCLLSDYGFLAMGRWRSIIVCCAHVMFSFVFSVYLNQNL